MKLFGLTISRDQPVPVSISETLATAPAATPATSQPLAESMDLTGQVVDPRGPYAPDANGEAWIPLGMEGDKAEACGAADENQLRAIRGLCRYAAKKSPYAINGHKNRQNYIIGSGHTYTATVKKGMNATDEEVDAVQKALDDFVRVNKWHKRQRECLLRKDRDGEAFLRFSTDGEGNVLVRFVEPGQVATPTEAANDSRNTFGIRTDAEDVETVEGYFIDGKLVSADEIQHRKANVDSNVKRGLPLMWPALDILKETKAIRRNMAVGSVIQTSVAMTKTVAGGSTNGPSSLRAGAADATRSNPLTGKTEYFEQQRPGKIITKTDAVEYDFPFATTDYSAFVEVIANNLREISSMLVMPEFMFTSDASNGNFASTMVAEGPAVRNFETEQYDQREDDLEVMRRQVKARAAAANLPDDILERVEIDVQCPQLAVRDAKAETERRQILANNKILSQQTWSAEEGYDYAQEQENIEQHMDDHPDSMPMKPLDPNFDPGADPAEDDPANTDPAQRKPAPSPE